MDYENKVKALKDSIVQECHNQGFTLDEFRRLVDVLRFEYEKAVRSIKEATKI